MSTYRERRLARAERLREWADKREVKGTASVERGREMLSIIPFGQPILVDHYSAKGDRAYRGRATGAIDRGYASMQKADGMRSRADGIRSQADGAIYSDDPDAIEQLEAKLAGLEAKREKIKAHNKEMRKKGACDHADDCDCRTHYPRNCTKCPNHPLPGYVLSNLGGNITRARQRLEQLKRAAKMREAVVEKEIDGDSGTVVRITAARVEVEFPSKPSDEIRSGLKSHGFRWDRVSSCWYGRDEAYALETFAPEREGVPA